MNLKKKDEVSEREKIIEKAKEMGFTEEKGFRFLSPEEHRKLVRGKKIVLSEQFKEELRRLNQNE